MVGRRQRVASLWLGIDLASQNEMALKFDHMALKSWGLSNRTMNALLGYDFKMTVGDVIRASDNLITIRGLGEAGIDELNTKLSQLLINLQNGTEAQLFTDQNIVLTDTKTFIGPRMKLLPQSTQNLPLDQLHLEVKTHNALIKAGITTIGELYDASASYLSNIKGLHPESLGYMNEAIISLINSINSENDVNWFQYWKEQKISILPLQCTISTSSEKIIGDLPTIIEEVLRREVDERAGIIIKRRFGLGNVEKLTLEDIGNAFGGLSRERIRQLEERALKKLQEVFIRQHYAGKDYHVHPVVHLLINSIRNSIEAEPSKLLLETKLLEYVTQMFNIDTTKVKSSLFLILLLIDAQHIEFNYPNAVPAWGYIEAIHRGVLESGIRRLDDLLTRETSLPYTEFDILVQLNRKAKKPEKLTLAQLSWLIDLCNSIERREDDSVWGKFEYLKGRGNQAERLLAESGLPMSVADMAREINHRLVPFGQRQISETNLSNQLGSDDRLVPIGRSGQWGLITWTHIDTKSITALMEQYLIIQNKPTTVDEIYTYVSERRPVNKRSIVTFLMTERERFVRVGRVTWGLAKWTDTASSDTWNPEKVADFVANIFVQNKAKELDYKIIKEALMEQAGISAIQAQGLLNHNPVIRTRKGIKQDERLAVYQPNYKNIFTQTRTKKPQQRMSFRQQIEESVHNLLDAAPDKQMQMAELVRQLQKQFDFSEATLYANIGQMDSIERLDIPGSRKKMCRAIERIDRPDAGTLRERVSKNVRIILEAMPNKQMLMSDLIKRLQKEVSCTKATLYQYIGNLDYIERIDIPNSNVKLYRMKDKPSADLFPQVQNIANSTLREKVERTLPFLTDENVDIGLFLLSKEFEATLKTYFQKASAKGKLQSLPPGKGPDKWLLNGMVDCAKDNGIITDNATFHYLRQTRNDRAHGTMPSLAERQLLLKHVQYIAGLYIDYIKILDDLSKNL